MLKRLYSWYGKRVVLSVLAVVTILILGGVIVHALRGSTETPPVAPDTAKSVTVARVGDMAGESAFRVVGTVEAVSEANLQTEASGRVTSVNVKLSDQVAAGTIIASIENSREHASLLQAEGAYEATVAQNAQSDVGLDEAIASVENTYRDAFSISEATILNLVDELFTTPNEPISGFKLDSKGHGVELNETRLSLREMLTEWDTDIANNFKNSSPETLLNTTERNATQVNNFLTTLAQIVAEQEPRGNFTAEVLSSYKTRFESARASLNTILTDVSSARRTYEQAQLSASDDVVSLSDAQLKSALGALRAAQANYEKTLVRTPISGSVNALYLKAGEFVNQNTPAALVANNGTLEIKTAVSEEGSALISVGDSVSIDGHATGTISRIAPGVDPLSGKIEVRIAIADASDLTNGSTVGISFSEQQSEDENTEIVIPIAAVKILSSSPIVFSVSDENTLVPHAIVLGEIRGSMIVVTEGLTLDMRIITDARGMQEGEKIEVTQD